MLVSGLQTFITPAAAEIRLWKGGMIANLTYCFGAGIPVALSSLAIVSRVSTLVTFDSKTE
jgi:hypothetical protein